METTINKNGKTDPMAAAPFNNVGQPGNPAGIPNPRLTGHGIWGMRRRDFPINVAPALQLAADGYYTPGNPPPLAAPGNLAVVNPALDLFGSAAWNTTGTMPPTGVPFGAHPVKIPPPLGAAPGWQHVATLVLRLGEEFEAVLQQASELPAAVPSPQQSASEVRVYKRGLRALLGGMMLAQKAAEAIAEAAAEAAEAAEALAAAMSSPAEVAEAEFLLFDGMGSQID